MLTAVITPLAHRGHLILPPSRPHRVATERVALEVDVSD
jgi:hypothetical protein